MNVEEYRIPVFDTFNLSKGVRGIDSTHFGLGVNGEGKRTTSSEFHKGKVLMLERIVRCKGIYRIPNPGNFCSWNPES